MSTNQKAGYMIGLKTAMLNFQRKRNSQIMIMLEIMLVTFLPNWDSSTPVISVKA